MYGAVLALIIALTMILFVIYKSRFYGINSYVCRKSEIKTLLRSVPDDCIIEIWIGRNVYGNRRNPNSPGGDLRNNISE